MMLLANSSAPASFVQHPERSERARAPNRIPEVGERVRQQGQLLPTVIGGCSALTRQVLVALFQVRRRLTLD